jgi:hypothetical protein
MKLMIIAVSLALASATATAAEDKAVGVCFESENNRCYKLSKENTVLTVAVLGKVVQSKKVKEAKGRKIRKEFESILKIPPEHNIAKILECNTPVKISSGKKDRQLCFFKLSGKHQGKISDWVQLVSSALE